MRQSMEHSRILVMKFGGTSVGDGTAFRQVVDITRQARQDWDKVVVVTSAMSGVTDRLLESAKSAAQGDSLTFNQAAQDIRSRHLAVLDGQVKGLALHDRTGQEIGHLVNDFINLCQAIAILGEATRRALDAVASLGERLCVRLLAAALEDGGIPAQFVDATALIVTDDAFQDAHPDIKLSHELVHRVLAPILKAGQTPVVTGFIGGTLGGVTTTLGRGGSDYSAAILGAILPADEVWIWTDVDGVMTADPRLVKDAQTIPELSYREVGELAYFGAKVLHPKTIRPVIEAGIGLRVCNTFNPINPGTRLVADSTQVSDGVIKAVTTVGRLSLVTLEGRGMLGVPGVAARTFAAVAATGVSVPLITQASSEQSICFAIPIESAGKVIATLEHSFAREIDTKDIDRAWASEEVVIITVVGAGMRSTPGVAGRVFTALGKKSVNVIAVAQGSSEVSISLVVKAEDTREAVQALHKLIRVNGEKK
jgi:bifunctional aspartokinase / homoserine dehydrogenase 1